MPVPKMLHRQDGVEQRQPHRIGIVGGNAQASCEKYEESSKQDNMQRCSSIVSAWPIAKRHYKPLFASRQGFRAAICDSRNLSARAEAASYDLSRFLVVVMDECEVNKTIIGCATALVSDRL